MNDHVQVNIKTTDLLKLLSGLDPNMMAFAFLRLSDSFLDLAEGVCLSTRKRHP